jgi:CRISPR system Cascade subunit CasE
MEPVNSSAAGVPRIIVQSRVKPDWGRIGLSGWLADADRPLDLSPLLVPAALKAGRRLRFRLRANPCITRAGKRLGLLQQDEQRVWMERKGTQHGFTLPGVVMISEPRMLKSRKRSGQTMSIFSTLYDGVIEVVEPEIFLSALRTGIGHGKVMGLGLISIAPMG